MEAASTSANVALLRANSAVESISCWRDYLPGRSLKEPPQAKLRSREPALPRRALEPYLDWIRLWCGRLVRRGSPKLS